MRFQGHFHLDIEPGTLSDIGDFAFETLTRTSSLQIYFNLSYQVQHEPCYQYSNGRTVSIGPAMNQNPLQRSFFLDYGLFNCSEATFELLSPVFTESQIDSGFHEELFLRMCELHGIIDTYEIPTENNVLPFNIRVVKHCLHIYLEQEMIDQLIRQSMSEYESRNGNCGMVPTAPDSRKLKCVKVGDEEENNCSVCLEEMKGFGAMMPCGHIFHGFCISKWLETSHYCPLCRYQMPTGT